MAIEPGGHRQADACWVAAVFEAIDHLPRAGHVGRDRLAEPRAALRLPAVEGVGFTQDCYGLVDLLDVFLSGQPGTQVGRLHGARAAAGHHQVALAGQPPG